MKQKNYRHTADDILLLLRDGLKPFVKRQIDLATKNRKLPPDWEQKFFAKRRQHSSKSFEDWDVLDLLHFFEFRRILFKDFLGKVAFKSLRKLRNYRNLWAHQEPLNKKDIINVLDLIIHLLTSISSADQLNKAKSLLYDIVNEPIKSDAENISGSNREERDEINDNNSDRARKDHKTKNSNSHIIFRKWRTASLAACLLIIAGTLMTWSLGQEESSPPPVDGLCYQLNDYQNMDLDDAMVEVFNQCADDGHAYAQTFIGVKQLISGDCDAALKWLTEAADREDSQGQFWLGYMFARDYCGQKDLDQALNWLHLSADQNYVPAQNLLGDIYLYNLDKQNFEEAKKWYDLASIQDSVHAQFGLGELFLTGLGVPPDIAKAKQHYHTAANQNHTDAQVMLCEIYIYGFGVNQDYQESFKWCKLAAENNHPDAQYLMGSMYLYGLGVHEDVGESIKLYQLAAQQGHVDAQHSLGMLFLLMYEFNQNNDLIIEYLSWFRQAATNQRNSLVIYDEHLPTQLESWIDSLGSHPYNQSRRWRRLTDNQGQIKSQFRLGEIYYDGIGVARDDVIAIKWYREAASGGLDRAQNSLGDMYRKGQGVRTDFEKALENYRLAADQDYPPAQTSLGEMYLFGQGVEKRPAEAVQLFHRAADSGDAQGQAWLGWVYGNAKNYREALKWLLESANQENELGIILLQLISATNQGIPQDPIAQLQLGLMFKNGDIVPHVPQQAVKFLELAADQGNADAQLQLAEMLINGDDINPNPERACRLYQLAADQGHSESQFQLYLLFSSGRGGCEKDDDLACKWLRQAANHQHAEAQYRLGLIYYHGRTHCVEKDIIEAYAWFDISGTTEANQAKEQLKMSRSQTRQGRERSSEIRSQMNSK